MAGGHERRDDAVIRADVIGEAVEQDDRRATRIAMSLARDRAMLSNIKAKLKANLSTTALFDVARYTRHLEAAYTEPADIIRFYPY